MPGESGYDHAKTLWGHVVAGHDAQGNQILVAALWGGEVSNDHRPYYEAAFTQSLTGELHLVRVRHYWWDFAGLEGGVLTWLGAVAGILGGIACWTAYEVWSWRSRRR